MDVKDEKFGMPQVWDKEKIRHFTNTIQTLDFPDTGRVPEPLSYRETHCELDHLLVHM